MDRIEAKSDVDGTKRRMATVRRHCERVYTDPAEIREVQEKRIEAFKRKESSRTTEEEQVLQSIYLVLQGCLKTRSTDLKMRL